MDIKKHYYLMMHDRRQGIAYALDRFLLWVFSLGYRLIAFITRKLYENRILPVYQDLHPVISVGNITMGGVGKTPLVIWIAKKLEREGLKVVVLSGGYKAKGGLNDEGQMFKEILPEVLMMSGRDRRRSIQRALALGPVDIFVADDAFQHWPLYRDLDIVAIDATNPFGNGQLVPRGILREPLTSLTRASIFVITKVDQAPHVKELYRQLHYLNPKALIVKSQHIPLHFKNVYEGYIQNVDTLHNQRAVCFCAIGNPWSFEYMLRQSGVNVVKSFTFEDHFDYTEGVLKELVRFAKAEHVNYLVTTHKDAVKIGSFQKLFDGLTVLCLEIEIQITQGENEFVERILSLRRD